MNDMTVGKNGIHPPRLAPAVITRPGDPGFSGRAIVTKKDPVTVSSKTSACFFCGKEYVRTSNRQKRCAECAAKQVKPDTKPKPSEVADAIGKMRQKTEKPKAKPELYHQLSERKAQMLADIEAIDRVLAIV